MAYRIPHPLRATAWSVRCRPEFVESFVWLLRVGTEISLFRDSRDFHSSLTPEALFPFYPGQGSPLPLHPGLPLTHPKLCISSWSS